MVTFVPASFRTPVWDWAARALGGGSAAEGAPSRSARTAVEAGLKAWEAAHPRPPSPSSARRRPYRACRPHCRPRPCRDRRRFRRHPFHRAGPRRRRGLSGPVRRADPPRLERCNLAKLAGGNVLRVMRRAEAVAFDEGQPPSMATLNPRYQLNSRYQEQRTCVNSPSSSPPPSPPFGSRCRRGREARRARRRRHSGRARRAGRPRPGPIWSFAPRRFTGWNPARRGRSPITTRFGNTNQLHEVAAPLGDARARSASRPSRSAAAMSRQGRRLLVVAEGRRRRANSASSTRWTTAGSRCSPTARAATISTPGAMTAAGSPTPRPAATAPTTTSTSSTRAIPRATGCSPRSRAAAGASPISRPTGAAPIVAELHLGQQDRPLPARRRQRPDDSDRRPSKRRSPTAAPKFAPDGTLWVTSRRRLRFPAARHARPRHRPIHAGRARSRAGTSRSFDISRRRPLRSPIVVNEAGISRLNLLDPARGAVAAPSPAFRPGRRAASRSRPGATSA